MDELHKKAENSSHKKMLKIPNGEHNDTWCSDFGTYFKYMNSFISKCIDIKNSQ